MNSKERVDVSRELMERGVRYTGVYNSFTDWIGYEKAYLDYFKYGSISFNDFKERFVCDYDEYEILACHQANKLIISNLARKIKFPLSKIPLSIVDYGNTGCASIPLAICEHYSNKNTSQDSGKILTCGFGIGLSLGIVGITVEPQNCFPVFRVKERYDDGLSFEDYK
jgi:3-oxoacyl-[acyl-carrier-protein] synthase-3